MRDTFVRTLLALAKEDPNIELMTGDLGFGVLKPFWEQLWSSAVTNGIFIRFGNVELSHDELFAMAEQAH